MTWEAYELFKIGEQGAPTPLPVLRAGLTAGPGPGG